MYEKRFWFRIHIHWNKSFLIHFDRVYAIKSTFKFDSSATTKDYYRAIQERSILMPKSTTFKKSLIYGVKLWCWFFLFRHKWIQSVWTNRVPFRLHPFQWFEKEMKNKTKMNQINGKCPWFGDWNACIRVSYAESEWIEPFLIDHSKYPQSKWSTGNSK